MNEAGGEHVLSWVYWRAEQTGLPVVPFKQRANMILHIPESALDKYILLPFTHI